MVALLLLIVIFRFLVLIFPLVSVLLLLQLWMFLPTGIYVMACFPAAIALLILADCQGLRIFLVLRLESSHLRL